MGKNLSEKILKLKKEKNEYTDLYYKLNESLIIAKEKQRQLYSNRFRSRKQRSPAAQWL